VEHGFLPLLAQTDTRELVDRLARTPLSQVVLFVAVLTVVRLALYPLLKNVPPHKRGAAYGAARFVNEILDAFVYAGVFVFLIIRPFFLQAFLIPSGSMWPALHVNDFIVANKLVYRYSEPKREDIVVFRPPAEATSNNPEQRDPETGEVRVDYIKRLIGVPGDVVELREGQLFRNGKPYEEPYKQYTQCVQWRLGDCVIFRPVDDVTQAHMTKASFKLVEHEGAIIPLNYTQYDANSQNPVAGLDGMQPYAVASKFWVLDQEDARNLAAQEPQPVPAGYFLMMGDNRNGSFDSRGWGLVPRDSIIGRSEFIWFPFSRWGRTR
jgi:signal peptidase I